MPNWCSNEVQIDGTKEDIAKFREECFTEHKGSPVLDFAKIIPEPDYDKPQKDGTHNDGVQTEFKWEMPDWWNWRNDNWGTKWNLVPSKDADLWGYDADMALEYMFLSFDTAWSPPNGIYNALVDKYPDLSINWFYREDGVQIAGWLPYD